MVEAKVISSLEKVMLTDDYDSFDTVKVLNAARGERASFQVVIKNAKLGSYSDLKMSVRSKLLHSISIARVGHVPSEMPAYLERSDDDYITKEPGLFPDVLYPIKRTDIVRSGRYYPDTLWFTVDIPADAEPGDYPVCITFTDIKDETKTKVRVVVSVKNAVIDKNDLIFTQWFHCDSIADYFGVKMMSERHWKLIEQFIKTAARTGITMLLTPLFTPPLDTAIGTERPTMQLVRVVKTGDKYTFDFTLLERWVKLCRKYGIEYFEMSHLFTQWGVCACPKIVVNVDGKDEKLFGWHVAAMSDMYKNFLSQFLPALTAELDKLGIADKCYFHISDEPSVSPEKPDYENYLAAKEFVAPLLKGCKIMDALSHVEFYDNGLIEYPVCSTNHLAPFMERDIKERWCYYCCSQGDKVANRFFAMPSYRNRISGVQLYVGDMVGFLQWGFNFYYSANAVHKIDPYVTSDGLRAWPSGDPFSVYPYKGTAIESIRSVVFFEGLQDRMLLKMLEKKIGRDKVLALISELAGGEVTFEEYPKNSKFLVQLHDRVLKMLG